MAADVLTHPTRSSQDDTASFPSQRPIHRRRTGGVQGLLASMWAGVLFVQQTATYWRQSLAQVDGWLLGITLALTGFGLFMLYSASAADSLSMMGHPFGLVVKQVLFIVIGLGAMLVLSRIPYTTYEKANWRWGGWLGVMSLLLATSLMGTTANGSERWLSLGFVQIQPSELAKPVGALLLAFALSRPRGPEWLGTLVLHGAAYLAMVAFIFEQPNLSISLLLMSTLVTLTFVAGLPMMLYATVLPLGLAAVAFKVSHTPYQRDRIVGWLHPEKYPDGIGYNLIQSLYAFGHGGLVGKGYGQSIQKHFYLPFHYTDFIFSVIGEELGLLGTLGTVLLYGILAWRGLSIAYECPRPFGQLLALGLTCLIVFQAIINLCVATQLFPVTGVTLPLISYGGTSVVVTLAMIGVLLNLSRAEPLSAVPSNGTA
jgi:cell division protein FtsW